MAHEADFAILVSTSNVPVEHFSAGFVQVLENLESPGISGIHFPGLESPGILMQVLESPGNLNLATSF